MRYVQLSDDGRKVITLFGCPQPQLVSEKTYAEMADDDPRYLAFVRKDEARVSSRVAISSGVEVRSASNPTINGCYPVDQQNISRLTIEAAHIHATSAGGVAKFSHGLPRRVWRDIDGKPHNFTTEQFVSFSEAICRYVDELHAAHDAVHEHGTPWTPPSPVLLIP